MISLDLFKLSLVLPFPGLSTEPLKSSGCGNNIRKYFIKSYVNASEFSFVPLYVFHSAISPNLGVSKSMWNNKTLFSPYIKGDIQP